MDLTVRYKVDYYENFNHSYIEYIALKNIETDEDVIITPNEKIINRYDFQEGEVEYMQTYKKVSVHCARTEKPVKNINFLLDGKFKVLWVETNNYHAINFITKLVSLSFDNVKFDSNNEIIKDFNAELI